jgi:radical SAM superfamily enzyme YgiQ (UPF0313 family)
MGKFAFIATYDNAFNGIRILSSCLKNAGHETLMITFKNQFDYTISDAEPGLPDPVMGTPTGVTQRELDLLVELLVEHKVDYVGLSVVTHFCQVAQLVTKHLRKALPQVPVIWGGIDTTMFPKRAIEQTDIIAIGECELSLVELVAALDAGRSLEGIEGVWFRNANGEIVRNGRPKTLKNLDELPFPDWSWDNYYAISRNTLYPNIITSDGFITPWRRVVMTSRGCPFACAYCFHGSHAVRNNEGFDESVRRRSVDNVIAELKYLRETTPGLTYISFFDEVFTLMPKWIVEFSERYSKEIGLDFSYYTYPKTTKKVYLDALIKCGMQDVVMGVQTGSDKLNRDIYNRTTSKKNVLDAAELINSYGIEYHIDLLGECPLEQEEDYRETVDLMLRLPRPFNIIGVYKLHFYRDYHLTLEAQKQGHELTQVNENTWVAPSRPEYKFWENMFYLAALGRFTSQGIEPFMNCGVLRENQQALDELVVAMQRLQYIIVESVEKKRKDRYIAEMEGDLAKICGVLPVRLWVGLKNALHGGWIDTASRLQDAVPGADQPAGSFDSNIKQVQEMTGISDQALSFFANSKTLRDNPVALEDLVLSLRALYCAPGSGEAITKDEYIRLLETNIAKLRGSRPVKWYIDQRSRKTDDKWLVGGTGKGEWIEDLPDMAAQPTRMYDDTNRP